MSLSPGLADLVAALPLIPGLRILEIGCGPGGAARAASARVASGRVVAIDRSPRAVALARTACAAEIAAGLLDVRCVAVGDFALAPGEPPFDLAFAFRVGALDGRHPRQGTAARARIAAALAPDARLCIDVGDPLRVVDLARDLGAPPCDVVSQRLTPRT